MQKNRKVKTGRVLRRSGSKTAVIQVERTVKEPEFGKYVTRRKRFHVHDEANAAAEGDRVVIMECHPVSKTKNWRLHSVIEKAR